MAIKNLAQMYRSRIRVMEEGDTPDFWMKYRPYQQEAKDMIFSKDEFRPTYICWCRRAGKDAFTFMLACEQALRVPNSRIMYLFPTKLQGKQAILEGVFLNNEPFITSVVNEKHLKKPRNGNLYHYDNTIRFKNGSVISIVGDDSDNLVGSNVNFLVVSEAAMVSKETIDYLIPSIIKIKGRVVLVSSPRYGSHFNQSILDNTGQILTSVLPANVITDENGNRVYTDEELELAKSTMSIERYRSEYMVDLSSHNVSSIYGASFEMAHWIVYPDTRDKRVFISLDLGISDNTALTFGTTNVKGDVEVIHQYRNRGQASQHYIDYIDKWLHDNKIAKQLCTIILPHDSNALADAGKYLVSRAAMYQDAGFHIAVLRPVSVLRAIEITRAAIQNGRLKFADTPSVRGMVQVIKAYEFKTLNGVSLGVPNHGTGYSASNDADSLEYLCLAFFYDTYSQSIRTESGVIIKK